MVTQIVEKFLHIMEPECSLPCSHQPASGLTASVQLFNPSFCNIRLCVLAPCGNGAATFQGNCLHWKVPYFSQFPIQQYLLARPAQQPALLSLPYLNVTRNLLNTLQLLLRLL
jgi:hypothetical protein